MNENIQKELRLKKLKGALNEGVFDEQKRKKEEDILRKLISGALFLEEDEIRKNMWLDGIDALSAEEMIALGNAIMRENLRWKKGERKIKFKKIDKVNIYENNKKNRNKLINQKEKIELLEKVSGEKGVQDLDFSKKPEDPENRQILDNMSLVLLMGLAEIFETEGYKSFERIKFKLRSHPGSFTDVDENLYKALQQIQSGIDNEKWQSSFAQEWADFVDSIAASFVLAKEAESEVTGIRNNFSNFLTKA